MDKNQFIGLILMLVLITAYFQFFAPEVPPPSEIDNQIVQSDSISRTDRINSTPAETQISESFLSDSAKAELSQLKYGLFSSVADGEESFATLENENLEIVFSNKGGLVKEVRLKNYQNYDGTDLILVDENHAMDLFFEHQSKQVKFSDLTFSSSVKNFTDSTVLTFGLNVDGSSLKQIYSLSNDTYTLDYTLESKGFEKQIDPKNLKIFWTAGMAKLETDLDDTRRRTTVSYGLATGDVDNISRTATSHEEETVEEPVKWITFNQKFFSSGIIAKTAFPGAFVTLDPSTNSEIVKYGSLQTDIQYTDLANNQFGMSFYFGPNDYYVLKDLAPNFSENIDLGWFFLPAINKYVIIPIFNFLERFIPNYGIVIIIMVVLIRLMISPLTYSSHISMAKMRVLKPELDDIKERNDGDMQKAQSEQMDLYRKAGINPISGCIPVLLQFPILVSLFYFIPAAIELRQVPFLWAEDMSTYDSILDLPFSIPFYGDHVSLFTLLMAGSTILYTLANAQMTTVQGPMKTLQYVMPIMLLFFFNSYPSGLSYYYFVSNLVSFGQIALFRKFIDEDKIRVLMENNKKKNANKKKSKFQSRLEDAMKANEAAQKKKKKK